MFNGIYGMEHIINRFIRVFYVLMIIAHAQLVVRILGCNILDLAVSIFAIINFLLYTLLLRYNLTGKYVQAERLLVVLAVSTVFMYVAKVTRELIIYDDALFVFMNTTVMHLLIEWIVLLRIATIVRLQKIAERGKHE
ncbi:MAG: hypothetical protein FWD45_00295 [Coriobacteriia bacterium]|nr:hypothetical protein [Coriobacteriia bacterium]